MNGIFRYLAGFIALAALFANAALATETIAYSYDELGRLVAVSTTGTVNSGQNVTTSFDPAGNRTNYTVTGVAGGGGGGGTPSVTIGAASANEGSTLSFPVTLSAASSSAVTVSYTTSPITAVAGTNYTSASSSLTIPAGSTGGTISVSTIDDHVVTGNLTMSVALSSPTNATLGSPSSATGTIVNIDTSGGGGTGCTPIIPASYSASSAYPNGGWTYTSLNGTGAGMRDGVYVSTDVNNLSSIYETYYEASPWIMMDLGSAQPVGSVVVVPVGSGSPGLASQAYLNGATLERSSDGASWTAVATVSGTAQGVQTVIPVNATTRYLRLRQTNFYISVGDFFASAASCSGGGGSTPTVSIGAASANEGTSLSFPVTLSAAASSAVTVNYATTNGSALAPTNYTTTSGTLTIPAGSTSGTITVPTIDDHVATGNLAMTTTLSAPTNATLGTTSATGTIVNIDGQGPTPTVSINPASQGEGNSLVFVVNLSATSSSAITVNYASSDGTAHAGTNYTTTNGTLTIPANSISGTISVPTRADGVVTADLTMTMALSGPSNATLGTASATGTIRNLDMPTISIGSASANEGGNLTFPVTLSAASPNTVSAYYTTTDGTAIAGTNYTTTNGTLTIPAGSTSGSIIVPTIHDNVTTANLTMSVTLSPSNATVGNGTGTGTIANIDGGYNPTGSYSLTSGSYYVDLGQYGGFYVYGYAMGSFGALSPNTFSGNYQITVVEMIGTTFYFEITNLSGATVPPNSGWTSITVPGLGTMALSAMTYATGTDSNGHGYATWQVTNYGTIQSGTVTIQ